MQATILEETFCKLCLNTTRDSNCRVIEEVIRDVLKIVLPHVNLEENVTHFICTTCSVKLLAAFNFKSVCMDTEDFIFPHINASEMSVIDLKEIYLKEKGNIQLIDVSEDWTICRLCFQPVTYEFVALNEVDIDIIDTYIPQVTISATRDPVICRACFDSLRTHGSFLKNCLDAQERYTSDDKQSYIKSEEIEIKLEDPQDCDTLPQTIDNKPLEKSDCKDTAEEGCKAANRVKKKRIYIKHQLVHKDPSQAQMYKCNDCDYKTKYKSGIKKHQLKHKDASQIQRYKCNDCDYETKYKYAIKQHQLKHKDIENYSCTDCDFRTKYKNNIKSHQLTHKDPLQIQMYKCNDCDYKTKYKKHINRHQLTHKDPFQIQMYKCNDCDYKTKYKRHINRHQLTHKDPFQIQMYKCNDCDYKTKYKSHLSQHQLKHKDVSQIQMYRCNDCDFRTKYKNNIKHHQLKHKDPLQIQMYKCNDCDYRTKYKNYITQHQLKHKDVSQIQMYRCNDCDYETIYKIYIKRSKHTDVLIAMNPNKGTVSCVEAYRDF
ncbi:zinc finger protein 502-like [Anoplophora glabripennis]|uniref:zinc finger protein 502-like n=1 Tax=Anoplophora glabripennis TaxID=217634 RepID=UPI000C75EFB6|nr:zinc finger protein 502-like [Anoplophora glabripennis]